LFPFSTLSCPSLLSGTDVHNQGVTIEIDFGSMFSADVSKSLFSTNVSKFSSATDSVDSLTEKSSTYNFSQDSIIKEIHCLNLKIIVKCLSTSLSEYETYLKNISSLFLKELTPIKSANRGFLANLAGNEDYNIYFKYIDRDYTDFIAFQNFIPALKHVIVRKAVNFYLGIYYGHLSSLKIKD
jgi:hypothetical protein